MTHRIRRAVAAVAVTAASLGGTVALATPAFAAGSTAFVSFGNLIVSGGPEANNIRFVRSAGAVLLTDTNAAVTAGVGCQQQTANSVRCSGVQALNVNGRDGDDFIANSTNLGGALSGGNGNDVLLGGSGGDQLFGNLGNDRANGGRGTDVCVAEAESNCEQN